MREFDNITFRCSLLGKLMTNKQGKTDTTKYEDLSETCKQALIEMFIARRFQRHKDISNKYIEKGLMVEEDAVTLYSRLEGKFFKKNKDRIHNEYINGEPDLFTGVSVFDAQHVHELKSSWDIFTFYTVRSKPIDKNYLYQINGYMALTGAKAATLGYCLINTPEPMINDEKRKLFHKMNVLTDQNPDYIEACKHIDASMTFDDIALEDRVIKFLLERDEALIESIYARVPWWRQFLNEFAEGFKMKLKAA